MNWIGLYTFIRKELERVSRVPVQVLVTPWVSALLYIFIFGHIVGGRIGSVNGFSYIDFVLPGILAMNIMSGAFTHTSSSIYMYRLMHSIEEILVAPLSYFEMIIGFVSGAVLRTLIIGAGILIIALFFSAATITHLGLFFLTILVISLVFALVGIIVGLWADSFEQLGILNRFVLMPLSFLGGMFYSITMLPENFQVFAHFNPFFYFIDAIRYTMLDTRESNPIIGYFLLATLAAFFSILVWHLFKKGWRIRK